MFRDKTNKMACAPSEDSDQPGHPTSLKKDWVFSYPTERTAKTLSDWVDAQADLSLRWAHRSFCWFCHEVAQVMFRGFCDFQWPIAYPVKAQQLYISPWHCVDALETGFVADYIV